VGQFVDPMMEDRDHAGIAGEDFVDAAGGRVACEGRVDVAVEAAADRRQPAAERGDDRPGRAASSSSAAASSAANRISSRTWLASSSRVLTSVRATKASTSPPASPACAETVGNSACRQARDDVRA